MHPICDSTQRESRITVSKSWIGKFQISDKGKSFLWLNCPAIKIRSGNSSEEQFYHHSGLNRLNLQIFFQIFCAFIRSDRAVSGQVWRTFHVLWTNKWKRTTSNRRKHIFSNSDSFQFMVSRHSQLYVDVCTVCFGHPDSNSYLFGQASICEGGHHCYSARLEICQKHLSCWEELPYPSCWTWQGKGSYFFWDTFLRHFLVTVLLPLSIIFDILRVPAF